MKKHLQLGMLSLALGGLWASGCGGSAVESINTVSDGIPEGDFELFAYIIHNIDTAEAEIMAFGQARNFPAQREAQARLRQHQAMLDHLLIQKYGADRVVGWRKTLQGADVAYAKMQEERLRGADLLERFEAAGARGQLDDEGYVVVLDCHDVILSEDMIQLLPNCPRLRNVNLSRTKLHDRHCKILGRINSLEEIDLSGNPLRGHHLGALKELRQLHRLDLSDTELNDLSLPHFETLEHLKGIRDLNVRGTRLNNESCQRLIRLFRQADVRF